MRPLLGAALLAALAAPPAHALNDKKSEQEAWAMFQEEEVVGATKRALPLSETPSSVTVITAAEIRALGYRTLGEALSYVRGVMVSSDRNYSYLGVRGIRRPGDYNDKVLVTIDGHTMNGIAYGDAAIGRELGLDLESVERIEVVRGPGSALYGSYAVLAVINVITRGPGRDPGVRVYGRYGGWNESEAYAALSGERGGDWAFRLTGSWQRSDGKDLYFREFDTPQTHSGMARGADGEHSTALYGILEWRKLHLAAKWNERSKRFPTAAFLTTFGDPRNRTWDGHDFVELSTSGLLSPAVGLFGRAYWDGARYRGVYVYGPDSATTLNYDRGDGDRVGFESRAVWSPAASQVWSYGIEGSRSIRLRFQNFDDAPFFLYSDQSLNDTRGAVYAQVEQRWESRFRFTAGARWDIQKDQEGVWSPRLDAVTRLDEATTVKLLYGRSFHAADPYMTQFSGAYFVPNASLRPERVSTGEIELERRFGPATVVVSAYKSWIRDLIDLVSVDSIGTGQYQNGTDVASQGVEGELRWENASGLRVRASLACQDSDLEGMLVDLSDSPRWNGSVAVTRTSETSPLSLGLGFRYLSQRLTLAGARTRAVAVTDARAGVRLRRGWEIALEGRNLFDERYGDPASQEHVLDQIPRDSRTVYFVVRGGSGVRP